jgi:very-short-patch-repair endonuclease
LVEKNYKRLFDFISYLEDDSIEFCEWQSSKKLEDGGFSMPYPVYDEKLHEFIHSVYDSGIMLDDYLDYLRDKIGSDNDLNQVINDTDDIDTLGAVLTYYVRQEKFHDGLWGRATKDKTFLNILVKMRELGMRKENNDKKEYIARQLARTHNKKYENYVITRIWHKLDRLDVKLVTQQYVSRSNGHALIDLYFPQIGLFIEVDEDHHHTKANLSADMIRDKDVVAATENQIIRVDVTKSIEDIHRHIDDIFILIHELIEELGNSFIPWNITQENDPLTYINKGKISLKDNVAFSTSKDACNCFGYNYKSFQRGGTKHPNKSDTTIWFPKLYPHGEWENKISSDGRIIWERNMDETKNSEQVQKWLDDKRDLRIVFAQGRDSLGFMRYRFKGVFKLNREKTVADQCAVWEKIADEVETINNK